jgi:glycosyltransferase 2 family protein
MKLLSKIILVLISIIGLYSAFLIVSDINIIFDKILNFKVELLPIIFSLIIFGWFIHFTRWHLLLKNSDIHIPFKNSFSIYLAQFSLAFIPGEIGDLIKVEILKRKFNISRTKSSPIIISEWIYTGVGLVFLSFVGIFFFEFSIYVSIVFGSFITILFIAINSKKMFTKIITILGKIKFISNFTKPLENSFDGIKKSMNGKIAIYCSLLSITFWLIESIVVFFIMLGYGITSIQILDIIPMYSTSILLGFVSFLPLGIGVVEGTFSGFLSSYGIDFTTAFTVAIIIRLFTRWIQILVGIVFLKLNGGMKIK